MYTVESLAEWQKSALHGNQLCTKLKKKKNLSGSSHVVLRGPVLENRLLHFVQNNKFFKFKNNKKLSVGTPWKCHTF